MNGAAAASAAAAATGCISATFLVAAHLAGNNSCSSLEHARRREREAGDREPPMSDGLAGRKDGERLTN